MTDDDRFEHDLRAVVRDGAPDVAPATLRRDLETALAAPPVAPRRQQPWAWLAGAVAVAAVVLATAILGPELIRQPAATLAVPSTGTALATLAPTSPEGSTPEPAPTEHALPEPILHPGFIQIGELMTVIDGWAQNTDGHVLLTHSSGAAWRDITPPELATEERANPGVASELAPHFLDGLRGWIMHWIDPSDPTTELDIDWWRTSDAGVTWVHSVLHDALGLPNDFGWFDANSGWLVTDPPGKVEPLMRWTNDGGSTWSEPVALRQASGTSSIEWVKFVGPATGFIGADGSILRTIDGGRTWTDVDPTTRTLAITPNPLVFRFYAPTFFDATRGLIEVGIRRKDLTPVAGLVYATDDAGASWHLVLHDDLHRSWLFVDPQTWIALDGTHVWMTTDAGTTIDESPSSGLPVPLQYAYGTFVDPLHAWVSAAEACPPGIYCSLRVEQLYRTSDGGQSWTPVGDCSEKGLFPCSSPGPS